MSRSICYFLYAVIVYCTLIFTAAAQTADLPLSSDERAWLSQNRQVTLGILDHGRPPFEQTDSAGNLVGLGPDYMALVAKKLGLKVVVKRYPYWADVLAAACAGDIDLVMNIALVPDRTGCLVFSRPYLDIPNVVVGNSALGSMDDSRLAAARIAVERETSSSAGVSDRYPQAKMIQVGSIEEAFRAVLQGKADVYIGNPYVVAELLRMPEYSELAILSNAGISFSSFHFAVIERAKPLAGAINKALATITDEQRNTIRERWLVVDDVVRETRGQRVVLNRRERDWIAGLPPLRLGFNTTWEAISPESEGRLGGISGEYAQILEERLGIHFIPVPVGGQTRLAKLVEQDKVDLAITTGGRAVAAGWHQSEPMLRLANVIVGRSDRVAITGVSDLNGQTVATVGPGRQAHILRVAPAARIVQVDSPVEGLRMVEQGTVNMYVGDVVNVNRTLRDERMALQILAPAGFEEVVVFAVSPRHAELVPIINRVISGLSDEENHRLRSDWLQLNVQYGVHWRSVIAWMFLAALMAGILTFAYIHLRRAIAGREQAFELIADLTRNLPGVVFKIAVRPNGAMKTVFVGGNTEEIFGISSARVQASVERLLDTLSQDDRDRLVSTLRNEAETSVLMNMMVGERWIRMSAASLASGNGKTHWSGYFADATEEQAQLDALAIAKVQAELAANTKATFLATMSHEIRTPMSGLSGLLELLSRSGLAAEQRRMLELAIAAARSLRLLLDDILDFSRIESGRLHVETADIRPRELLCEVGLLMSGIAEQKGVGFECHIDGRLAGVLKGDGARIRQIVINLLSNAIKFTERGHVALRAVVVAEAEGVQSWAVEVSDTGIGIEEDALAALFQPFVQAHSNAEARTSGSGLGLVIARRLAELMGGTVSLASQVGRGTTARLDLHNTIVERSDTHVALVGKKVLLLCEDATVHADIRDELATLGMILVADVRDADMVMTDEDDGALAAGRPVVTLIMATPLATLSTAQLSLACEPVLFSAVRDVCLRALGDATPPSGAIEARSELFHGGGNAPVVLVAEDDPTSQVLIRGQLAELGCQCDVVGDGVEALLALDSGGYDLVITDMGMPRLDGVGLAREIRRRELATGLRMPIMALTAGAFPEDAQRCLDAGMDGHLSKPASLAELSAALKRWLGGARPSERHIPIATKASGSKVPDSVMQAFSSDAHNLRDEMDAVLRTDDPRDMERALHRIAGALACVGHTSTAQRIRRVIALIEADGVAAHRLEITELHDEVINCIDATVKAALSA